MALTGSQGQDFGNVADLTMNNAHRQPQISPHLDDNSFSYMLLEQYDVDAQYRVTEGQLRGALWGLRACDFAIDVLASAQTIDSEPLAHMRSSFSTDIGGMLGACL